MTRSGFVIGEAYERLAYTLFTRLPEVLAPEPSGLSPREVSMTLLDLRDQLRDTGRRLRSAFDFDALDRATLREAAQQLMQQIADLSRRRKARDILVIEIEGDWPLVRKRRAPLSDWDIWTLHTALNMLRRSYAMVTDAERYEQARPARPPSAPSAPTGQAAVYTYRAYPASFAPHASGPLFL